MATTHDAYYSSAERILVGSVPFVVTSIDEAAQFVLSRAGSELPVPIRLANAFCVASADSDKDYRAILQGPGLNFPDGQPVVWFMRAYGNASRKPERVRGPSFFEHCLKMGRLYKTRHFFVGTSPSTLNALTAAVSARFPGAEIAGSYAPDFAPISEAMIERIAYEVNSSDCDLVWVAMGTPKQDFVAAALAPVVNRPCIGVGAAFDFVAGTTREAPSWIQRSSLEWLYRLATEPGRLWRRYLFGNARFLYVALLRRYRV
ncbi:WecB/TagA/CpsF family glycosyltransferase [Rhodococcoides corynebacterioides]|uniref:WecB/TagA/CpsF family glycosyltransferase n=1 Tax=Rhodococcoides corynebacterioides TaxID=53972 RepID=UPI001C9B8CDD|nr:WecB/TagA/CpsF family glycosyltransferase [Rhodococcus corynebacterioides]MBY6349117.1 WecB/TagA/CpsF family glycosyltransferase [Rhodococcus corynebacterioides]